MGAFEDEVEGPRAWMTSVRFAKDHAAVLTTAGRRAAGRDPVRLHRGPQTRPSGSIPASRTVRGKALITTFGPYSLGKPSR